MLSAAQFRGECQAFAAAWNALPEAASQWCWRGSDAAFSASLVSSCSSSAPLPTLPCKTQSGPYRLQGGGFLALDGLPRPLQTAATIVPPELQELGLCADQDPAGIPAPGPDLCTLAYHILYSPSYGVPVMYFNATHLGAAPPSYF